MSCSAHPLSEAVQLTRFVLAKSATTLRVVSVVWNQSSGLRIVTHGFSVSTFMLNGSLSDVFHSVSIALTV